MKNEKGFSLIEIMIALALLGVIAVAFLGALATASNTIIVTDKHATAESLARSEMEFVKKQDYSSAPWNYTVTSSGRSSTDPPDNWWTTSPPPLLSSDYNGYTVTVSAGLLQLHATDDGIQKITITVKHISDDEVIILKGYKTG
jgi:prepilin-type N-terminal cleavage/methylation domain-containing protein